MRRRDFIKAIAVSTTAWPLVARAQQTALPVVGFLSGGQPESWTRSSPLGAAFRGGLAEAGFVEGKNFTFEYRLAGGQFDRLPSLAFDLINRGPAVIVTETLPAALAAKAATSAIPVVFVVGEDPIKGGLVTSLNRPNANVTGVANFMNLLGAKRMGLASELVPQSDGLALLVNQDNPNAEVDAADQRAAADALGKRMVVLKANSDAEIEAAFMAASEHKVGALFGGARTTSVPGRIPPQLMIKTAKGITDSETEEAAAFFSGLKARAVMKVVESATVPKTRVAGWFLAALLGGETEPIAGRIIEVPEDLERFEMRDARSHFIAYVPPSSVEQGRQLATTGGNGKTTSCTTCHGTELNGVGPIPGLAGRSPSYLVRQLYDFQHGTRAGPGSTQMTSNVINLTLDDMVALAAYAASLPP